jgi:hypothetical protein
MHSLLDDFEQIRTEAAMRQRELATIRDYPALVAALRNRAAMLDTFEKLSALAGFPDRYLSKLLGPSMPRALGRVSFGPVLSTLGVALVIRPRGACPRAIPSETRQPRCP